MTSGNSSLRSPVRATLIAAGMLAFTIATHAQSAYQAEIDRWVMQDALDAPPPDSLLFVGSSSIRFWEQVSIDFAPWNVIQRGFGGSQFSDLNQFVDDIVLPYDPAAIFVFEGTNDVGAGKSAAQVFSDYLSFVNLVHSGQSGARPPIPIVYIGITPTPARWSLWSTASQVNAMVKAHAETNAALFYGATPPHFLATGTPPSSSLFLPDQLHLNQTGYDIWTSVLRPIAHAVAPPTRSFTLNPLHPPTGARLLFDLGPSNDLDGRRTLGPDANGNYWANWFTVTGGTSIIAGEHRGNLQGTDGTTTGFSCVITGELSCNGIRNGGLLNPDPALLGSLAIPTATADYFFGDGVFLRGGFLIRGLDPRRTFDLAFFGTRNTTETRTTEYRVTGDNTRVGTLTTSGPGSGTQSNGNDNTVLRFRRLQPDALGRLFIDIERTAGTYSYVGIVELTVGARRKLRRASPSYQTRASRN